MIVLSRSHQKSKWGTKRRIIQKCNTIENNKVEYGKDDMDFLSKLITEKNNCKIDAIHIF